MRRDSAQEGQPCARLAGLEASVPCQAWPSGSSAVLAVAGVRRGLGVHKSRSRRGKTREVCSAHGPPTANGGRGDGGSDAAPEGSPRKIPGTD